MKCPLCSADTKIVREALPGFMEGRSYRVRHCVECGTALADPLSVDPQIYQVIYAQAEVVPGYNRYSRYADEIARQRSPLRYLAGCEESYWGIVSTLERLFPNRQAAVLEVGCGLGYLTYALTKAGYRRVLGVDLSQSAVERARQRYSCDYIAADIACFASETEERFDALIFSEVLEHLEDPVGLLSRAKALLKPGGYLICTTPNRSFGGHPQKVWATDLPPVHLWWFTEQGLQEMAGRLDMQVEFVDYTPWYRRRARRFARAWTRSMREEGLPACVLDSAGKPRVAHHTRVKARKWPVLQGLRNLLYRVSAGADKARWRSSSTLCAIYRSPRDGLH